MSAHGDITADVRAAAEAQAIMASFMYRFQAACAWGDWAGAEEARVSAAAALDGYLDALGAIYKRMEYGG